jgi:hypothetical protein
VRDSRPDAIEPCTQVVLARSYKRRPGDLAKGDEINIARGRAEDLLLRCRDRICSFEACFGPEEGRPGCEGVRCSLAEDRRAYMASLANLLPNPT